MYLVYYICCEIGLIFTNEYFRFGLLCGDGEINISLTLLLFHDLDGSQFDT